jgi:hypothetical protein
MARSWSSNTTFRILLVSAALLPSSLNAQRRPPVPHYAVSLGPATSFAPPSYADSARAIPRTYWLEGGIVAGVGVGVLGALWFGGMSESPNPIGSTIAGGLLCGAVGFTAGALIGGQFRKSGH